MASKRIDDRSTTTAHRNENAKRATMVIQPKCPDVNRAPLSLAPAVGGSPLEYAGEGRRLPLPKELLSPWL
jgi:hypothetical protein